MGASRGSRPETALAASRGPGRESAAAVLDFAIAQLLRGDTKQMLRSDAAPTTLPAVLERMVTGFGLRAALAFQPSAANSAAVLAAHPVDAAGPELLARIGALSAGRRDHEATMPVHLALENGSALVAYATPTDGRCLCALALIGDGPAWDEEIRFTARAVAGIAAAQIRYQGQVAEQINRELAQHYARLRKTDEVRNQFLALVSHELRTPLTSIVSFIELIRTEADGLTPEGRSFLDIIERNADRMYALVGDLLMLDRLDAGALPLDLTEVPVAELATDAVRAAAPGAAKQGITLEVQASPGPPVRGDPRRLTQVLDNLIANAVKFSHRNGLVRVSTSCRGRTWRIDVADAGIGIPPEEVDQLFSRFVRGSNARTAGLPGSGLGLSIVKYLTEMHGGHVQVRSTLGRGSTFSVYLPAAPQ
jgi:signal transduction histidine kinase